MTPERAQFVERLIDVVNLLKYPVHGRQTALATRYKLKQPSVRKWFTGEAMPSYEILKDLAVRALVSYEWLMTGRGDKFALTAEMLDPKIQAMVKTLQNMSPHQINQAQKILHAIVEPDHPEASSRSTGEQ